jgi:hypothetical protein
MGQRHFYPIVDDPDRVTDQILGSRPIENCTATGIEASTVEWAFNLASLDRRPHHRRSKMRAPVIEDCDARTLTHHHHISASG